jgi:hypothetical protein
MHSAAPMTTEPPPRFAVALSFPGEVRARAEPIAHRLANELGRERVLYDRFHEAELALLNLDIHLQALYHDHAELIVIFLCKDYDTKDWCRLEWRAIRDLIKQRQREIILLRLDDAIIPGIYSVDGYIDLRKKTDDEVAALILQRSSQHNRTTHDLAPRQQAFSPRGNLTRRTHGDVRATSGQRRTDARRPRHRVRARLRHLHTSRVQKVVLDRKTYWQPASRTPNERPIRQPGCERSRHPPHPPHQ